jgi:hypothetical protein
VTHLALSTNEPVVTITVPVRLLPQLMAMFAVAATPASSKPCVETTAEEAQSPGVAKALPDNVRQLPARKVG